MSSPRPATPALILAALLALPACGNAVDDKPPPGGTTPSPSATPSATATAAATVAAAATPTPPAPLPVGRSTMPTLSEWGARKEVTVKGSSALACETKMVREYLRISCRGKNDSGGTPTKVSVVKGGRDALLFASGGVTSAIVPFVEGTDAALAFSWTDKSHTLTLKWPKGSPKPAVIGVFEGAQSPLDAPSDGALNAKLCECHKKTTREPTCENMMSGANEDCERTYGNDCQRLLECSRGEPSAFPSCPAGHTQMFHHCYKRCAPPDRSCPAKHTCDSSISGEPVCVAND